jgi:glycosyltransferase involved in cell wall biosynthesis
VSEPLVSVVIPAYNEQDYIRKCIQTLQGQSWTRLEAIIIDDGSTDRTRDIVRELARQDRRVRLLTQEHGGPGRARNLGVRNAKGTIIVLVDADMEFDREYVRRLIQPILRKEAIGSFHRVEHVANKHNLWARCWGSKRVDPALAPRKGNIFRAILRKEFLRAGGFDPKTGTFDDQSLAERLGAEAIGVDDAICYHHNPTTLSEAFHHVQWIGGSFVLKPDSLKRHILRRWKLILLGLAVMAGFALLARHWTGAFIPAIAAPFLLGMKRALAERDLTYLYGMPIFSTVFTAGFLTGFLRQLLHRLAGGREYKY